MKDKSGFPVATLKAHVALNVSNIDRSVEFYRALFGLEPSKVRSRYAKFDVANPALNLSLNEVDVVVPGALSHMGVQVASSNDVTSIREQWVAAGIAVRDELGTNCCYAMQDKAWAVDPDGNEWEAFVVLEDNLPESSVCCVPEEKGASSNIATPERASKPAPVAACCSSANECC
jgi:catechol 2,3-dioxygenase-like lactoylglutathione lyase family enzyme